MYLPNAPSRMASASFSLANRKGRSNTPSAGHDADQRRGRGDDHLLRARAQRLRRLQVAAERAAPEGVELHLAAGLLAAGTRSWRATPLPTGWSSLTPLETRMVRSWNCGRGGQAPARTRAAARGGREQCLLHLTYLPLALRLASASLVSPEQAGYLSQRSGTSTSSGNRTSRNSTTTWASRNGTTPLITWPERHPRHAADHVEHDADRRRDAGRCSCS